MNWQHCFEIIVLGFVEGITEFLPISSSAHLILLKHWLGFAGPPGKVFEVVIQFGAILAICVLYGRDLLAITRDLPRRDDHGRQARFFTFYVLLAFLPSAFLGAVFHTFIKLILFNPRIVCVPMILGGIAILLIEHFYKNKKEAPLNTRRAWQIGLCQCLALMPGVSRSGATILGGVLTGLSRGDAARFSFFVAIPTMLGAATFDLYKNWSGLSTYDLYDITLGLLVAFITALFTVRWLIAFVRRHDFTIFGWYRIALGSLMLLLL